MSCKLKDNIPLEIQCPQVFGAEEDKVRDYLDKEQYFAYKNGMKKLVLTENANELVRRFIQEFDNGYVMDYILEILGEYYNFKTIKSPVFMLDEDKYGNEEISLTEKEEFNDLIRFIKLFIEDEKSKHFATILGINLREKIFKEDEEDAKENQDFVDHGGHYCSLILEKFDNKVVAYFFDPMSGGYMKIFASIIELYIFESLKPMIKKDFTFELKNLSSINPTSVVQITGGFTGNDTQFVKRYMEIYNSSHIKEEDLFTNISYYFNSEEYTKLFRDEILLFPQKYILYNLNTFNTDTQNHFCYMWSIWFIHLFFSNYFQYFPEIEKKISELRCIPLVIIKRYIFTLLYGFRPISKIFNKFKLNDPNTKISSKDLIHFIKTNFTYIGLFPLEEGHNFEMIYPKISNHISNIKNNCDLNNVIFYSFQKMMEYTNGELYDFIEIENDESPKLSKKKESLKKSKKKSKKHTEK